MNNNNFNVETIHKFPLHKTSSKNFIIFDRVSINFKIVLNPISVKDIFEIPNDLGDFESHSNLPMLKLFARNEFCISREESWFRIIGIYF